MHTPAQKTLRPVLCLNAVQLLVIAVQCSVLRAAEPALARLTDGTTLEATLVGVRPDGTITLRTAGRDRQLSPADLVHWSFPVDPRHGRQIHLADGGLLVARSAQLRDAHLQLNSDLFGRVNLPVGLARAVVMKPTTDADARADIDRFLQTADDDTDRLLLANGDVLTGKIKTWSPASIEFETELGTVNTTLDKVAAVRFRSTTLQPVPSEETPILVGMDDGSLFYSHHTMIEPHEAKFTLLDGTDLTTDLPESVVALQPLDDRVVYLSDLAPYSYRHIPYLKLSWPFHDDRSVLGEPLRVAGRRYNKGLGTHSAVRLIYKLDQPFRKFQAELGIDDATKGQGSVTFRVLVSDGKTWNEVYTSPVVHGGDAPLPISVDLGEVKAIALAVDFADEGDVMDHADWLNARLIK